MMERARRANASHLSFSHEIFYVLPSSGAKEIMVLEKLCLESYGGDGSYYVQSSSIIYGYTVVQEDTSAISRFVVL
jgi:hypothetical protein